MLCRLRLLTLCVCLCSSELCLPLSETHVSVSKVIFLYKNSVTEPVLRRDGLPVGVSCRLRCHERCPGLLKELLRGSLGVLGETYEVSELLREVLGRTWESSGEPWEVLWSSLGGPLGFFGCLLGGPWASLEALGASWDRPGGRLA